MRNHRFRSYKNWNMALITFFHAFLLGVVLKQWFYSISKNHILRILCGTCWHSTLTRTIPGAESCIYIKIKCIILCIGHNIGCVTKQRETCLGVTYFWPNLVMLIRVMYVLLPINLMHLFC